VTLPIHLHLVPNLGIGEAVLLLIHTPSWPAASLNVGTDLPTLHLIVVICRWLFNDAFIIIIIYLNCKWVSTRWQWYYNRTTHITQITHHTQTKHSTQIYTNNKGHTTHTIKQQIRLPYTLKSNSNGIRYVMN
jgi:hypothetical protein